MAYTAYSNNSSKVTKLIKAQHNLYPLSLNTAGFNKENNIFHNQMQPLKGNTLCLTSVVLETQCPARKEINKTINLTLPNITLVVISVHSLEIGTDQGERV